MLLSLTLPNSPEETIGALAILGLLGAAIYIFCRWLLACPRTPDPWGAEVEQAVEEEHAVPVCPHSLTPQEHNGWFCPECGSASAAIWQLSTCSLHVFDRRGSQSWRSAARPVDSLVGDRLCFARLCLLLGCRAGVLHSSIHKPGTRQLSAATSPAQSTGCISSESEPRSESLSQPFSTPPKSRQLQRRGNVVSGVRDYRR